VQTNASPSQEHAFRTSTVDQRSRRTPVPERHPDTSPATGVPVHGLDLAAQIEPRPCALSKFDKFADRWYSRNSVTYF